jgi:hypothetical protein
MSFFGFSNLIISMIAILLGAFTFVRNRSNPINRDCFLTSIAISVWSFSFFLVVIASNYETADLAQYILDFSSIWVPLFFFHFVLDVLGKRDKHKVFYWFSLALES